MSIVFYDHLIALEELEHHVKKVSESRDEIEELWQLIDEIVHHRVLGCIFDKLPQEYHHEFLEKFHTAPYDEKLMSFINDKLDVEEDIEEYIKSDLYRLSEEILGQIA